MHPCAVRLVAALPSIHAWANAIGAVVGRKNRLVIIATIPASFLMHRLIPRQATSRQLIV